MLFSEMFDVQSYENIPGGINFNQAELTAIKDKVWVYIEKIGENEANELMNYLETDRWGIYVNTLHDKIEMNSNCFKELVNSLNKFEETFGKKEKTTKILGKAILYSMVDPYHDLHSLLKLNNSATRFSLNDFVAKFNEAATFSTWENYKQYEERGSVLRGRDSHKWIMPRRDAEALIKRLKRSNLTRDQRVDDYAKTIGYPEEDRHWLDERYASGCVAAFINLKAVTETGERLKTLLPNAFTGGANRLWLPGGVTSGGVVELVSEAIPNHQPFVTKRIHVDFKTGKTKPIPVSIFPL